MTELVLGKGRVFPKAGIHRGILVDAHVQSGLSKKLGSQGVVK